MGDIDNAKFDFVLNLVFMKNLSLIFFLKKETEREGGRTKRQEKQREDRESRKVNQGQPAPHFRLGL